MIKKIQMAIDLASLANTNVELTVEQANVLINEIERLKGILKELEEEIVDAQLIDLNWRESKTVRSDLLSIVRKGCSDE